MNLLNGVRGKVKIVILLWLCLVMKMMICCALKTGVFLSHAGFPNLIPPWKILKTHQ